MKYALVTGADHGVGLALVENLLERKYHVLACRINENETKLDELLVIYGKQLEIIKLDISDDKSVAAMQKYVFEHTPYLDLVINNAGILGDIEKIVGDDLDFEEMQRVINVNALGTLRVSNALVNHVLKSSLKLIINISSEAGSIQDCWREGWFGYCISKAGNNMQSALVHNYMRKQGGKVLMMHPGHVATYMRGHLDTTAKITPQISAKGILKIALDNSLADTPRPLYLDYEGNSLPY